MHTNFIEGKRSGAHEYSIPLYLIWIARTITVHHGIRRVGPKASPQSSQVASQTLIGPNELGHRT